MDRPKKNTTDPAVEDPPMSIGEHLDELRRRLIYALIGLGVAMAGALVLGREIIAILKHPYDKAAGDLGIPADLTVLTVTSGFQIFFRVSLYAGLILAAPWIIYQIWAFVSVGLKAGEKRYVRRAAPSCVALFAAGAAFFLFVVAEPSIRFLVGFNNWLGVRSMVTLEDHIGFMTNLMLVFGVAFQTPLVVLILYKIGLVSLRTLNHYRRHVVIVVLITAGILTPSPSPVDQLMLGIPMWMLYEVGVLLAWISSRRKRPERNGTEG